MLHDFIIFSITETLNISAIGAVIFYRKKIKAGVQNIVTDVKNGG